MKARLIPTWTVYNEMAGPQPFSFCGSAEGGEQEITLIPYGCTTLTYFRISSCWEMMFPKYGGNGVSVL